MIIHKGKASISKIAKTAAKIISDGGIVVAPFDTVYGFCCDPRSNEALEKIFKLKGRDISKTVGVAVNNISSLSSYVHMKYENFILSRTPGRFTFILPISDRKLSDYCYKNSNLAVRIPDSELVLSIAENAGGIVAQTSANKSGQKPASSLDDLKRQFSRSELELIDLIIDGGKIANPSPSEIYDLTGQCPVKIER